MSTSDRCVMVKAQRSLQREEYGAASLCSRRASASASRPLHEEQGTAPRMTHIFAKSRRMRSLGSSALALCLLPANSEAMVTTSSTPATVAGGGGGNVKVLLDTAMLIRRQREATAASSDASSSDRVRLADIAAGAGLLDLHSDFRLRQATGSPQPSWTSTLFDVSEDDFLDLEEDFDIASRVRAEVPALTDLQTATGSEIPDMELYLQMEAARKRATHENSGAGSAFIDSHVADATSIEKVAMGSIPLQLPGPAASVVHGAAAKATGTKSIATAGTGAATGKKGNKRSKKLMRAATTSVTPKARKAASPPADAFPQRKSRKPSELKMTSTPRVSHDEEIELARIIQEGVRLHTLKTDFETAHGRDITKKEWTELANLDSPKELRRLVSGYRTAKSQLVTANMGLVHAVVKANGGYSRSGVTYEELVQEGSLGLLRAAELFDPNRGLRFSTYATIWIKGVLGNSGVSETITLPLREKTKWNKIRQAEEDLKKEKEGEGIDAEVDHYAPTVEEIAERSGMAPEEVLRTRRSMSKAKSVLSLDYQYESHSRSGSDRQAVEGLQNDKAFMADADLFERLQLRVDVIAALARNLDPREARLMRLRYGLKDGRTRSLVECADAMGLSRNKVQNLAAKCLKKLREADDAESLQEYLLTVA